MKNNIELYELKYDMNDVQIVGREKIAIENLIEQLDEWHKELTDIILFPNNLYYFATNNFDSDFYLEQLTDENLELLNRQKVFLMNINKKATIID